MEAHQKMTRRVRALIMAAMLLSPGVLSASKPPAPVPGWDNIKADKLEFDQIEFLFKSARAMLETGTSVLTNAGVKGVEMPKRLAANDGRWVFLSLFRSGVAPMTVAGRGRSIIASLADAVERALAAEAFKRAFAGRLGEARVEIDVPVWIERIWPLTTQRVASKFDPAAYGLFIKVGRHEDFIIPVQHFARGLSPDVVRDQFLERYDMSSKKFEAQGGSVFMTTLDQHVEAAPSGLVVPQVRGKLLRMRSSRQLVESRCQMAARYLVDHQRETGAFFSHIEPRTGAMHVDKYTLRKHADATVALIETLPADGDVRRVAAANLAASYIIGECRAGQYKERRFLFVKDSLGRGSLGETAGATMALAVHASATGSHDNDTILKGLLDFLVFMQTFEGDFRPVWPGLDFDADSAALISPFLGQAVCALIEGVKRFPDHEDYAKAVRRSAALMLSRTDDLMTNRLASEDAWQLRALVALSRFQKTRGDKAMTARTFLDLAARLAAKLAERQCSRREADYPDQSGGVRMHIVRGGDSQEDAGLPAVERRLRVEPSALATAGALEGIARVTLERKRLGLPIKNLLTAVRPGVDFLVREQFDAINSYYFIRPERAMGGVRLNLDDTRITIDTMALFIRALNVSAEVLDE